MEGSPRTNWIQSSFFRWIIGLGAVRGTIVATLGINLISLAIAVVVMLALHRLSWMGVLISGTIPLFLIPLHWYPFARISEQLQATESRLRKSEGRYRSILEKMSEAYVELDQDGRLTFFNDSLCRITGYSRVDLERREITDFVTRHNFRRLRSCAARARRSGTLGGLFDFPIAAKDGATRYLDASFSLLLNEEGGWSGYHAVLFDVTERFHSEQEKRAIQNQLLRAKRMESLGILAGGVAHDLNNILCGIVGYPDMLLLDCRDDGFLRESLLAIKNSGEKAANVVQDLLTLSRRGVLTTEVVSLSQIITDYLKSPEHQLLERSFPGVVVTSELARDLPAIEGSSHHLLKTVMNLVLNAFEAIVPPGTVSLSTANRHLDRPLVGYDRVQPGEYVTLTVADSGVGISPEDTERIFEPFYTKKIMGRSGTGLGMAVVWGTVKDHRGYITVGSEAGMGSTIELFFPASRRELAARAPTPGIAHYPGHGESLLVVDDMLDQRILVSRMLERLGYRVHAVSSGEEAVEHVTAQPVDLVVLDMIMDPGIDGLDTYRKLRAVRPGVKAIITSGFSETDRVREVLRLGAGPCVKKPYRMETLARVVHEALHGAPAR
jgi:PAS domain S-box-containing protein